jgi:hypothetical protein
MSLPDPETLRAYIGGQMHFTLLTEFGTARQVRLNITAITPKDDHVVITGRCYRQPAGESVWVESTQNTYHVVITAEHGKRYMEGEIRIIDRTGLLTVDTLADAAIYQPGDGRIITINAPTETVDDVLRSTSHTYGLLQEHNGEAGGIVTALLVNDLVLPVVLCSYTVSGPARACIDTAVMHRGGAQNLVCVKGWVQHSDGSMHHDALPAVGFGTTFAEAVANFRAVTNTLH